MKIKSIAFILFVSMGFKAAAQSDISLEDLKMPSSPAFILLDVAPSSIDRPTTTKAFSTSILNSISENNGIPENYAIDFAPYWFFRHKSLNALNYWGINQTEDGTKQTPFSQLRFGNISFATVRSKIITDTLGGFKNVNNMAIGIRTTIFQLRNMNDINNLVDFNKKYVTRISSLMQDPDLTPIQIIQAIESDSILLKYNGQIRNILNHKPVFAIDLAAASSWSFDSSNYSSIQLNRNGAWLTLNYSNILNKKKLIDNDYLNIYAIARIFADNNLLNESGSLTKSSVFDSGGKIELELNRLAFSYEYLLRHNFSNSLLNSFRSSGLITYRASDQILVIGAFGKNFGDTNNLITQIGISWGLSTKNQSVNVSE